MGQRGEGGGDGQVDLVALREESRQQLPEQHLRQPRPEAAAAAAGRRQLQGSEGLLGAVCLEVRLLEVRPLEPQLQPGWRRPELSQPGRRRRQRARRELGAAARSATGRPDAAADQRVGGRAVAELEQCPEKPERLELRGRQLLVLPRPATAAARLRYSGGRQCSDRGRQDPAA